MGSCIHPGLISALSRCGHGDKVLLADGNYPLDSRSGEAEKIYLGLRPGIPTVTDVLAALQGVVQIEQAQVMSPDEGSEPEIFREFRAMLPELELEKLERHAFYDTCCTPEVRVAIATGEGRIFANLLLTIGVA